ncbi:acyl-CoA dehydrogenase family protein [Nocardia sp. NPDC057272]|uniref:acyl-CoA dehydrogenase family protein n=1 Tax=Nocardia sp. NPDC057272 TaxID=3346079 RepID=UPI003625D51B
MIETLGSHQVFSGKWAGQRNPLLPHTVALGERLGKLGSTSISVGVSLHDAAISIIQRFGQNEFLRGVAAEAIAGSAVLCIGATETGGGSDLQNSQSTAEQEGRGYRLRGHKKFVSLSPLADYVLLPVRGVGDQTKSPGGLALFVVPMKSVTVHAVLDRAGAGCLDTAPITFDTWVPEEMMLARPGAGLAAISWGLALERLSISSQIVGTCDLAIGVTVARMTAREQFGAKLLDHQILRLRMADLKSRVDVLRWGLRGYVHEEGILNIRTAAAFKVSAARLGNEVISECMHIFGGTGYLQNEAPLERWWRDMKLARIGGGTDEVLWELVAASLVPDHENYERMINEWSPDNDDISVTDSLNSRIR